MNLVARVQAILLNPKSEWPVIEREPGDVSFLFINYVAILAAIPAVCGFVGLSIVGVGGYRAGFFSGLLSSLIPALAILGLLCALYSLYLLYLGIPVLMKSPDDKSLIYTVVVVVCAIVVSIIIVAIPARLLMGL
jgi:hypothetical protein